MDYGSATGQDSLPPPLPTDPPARTPEVRPTRTAGYDRAGRPGAARRDLAQSQQAGLSAMFGLAEGRAPDQPPLAGAPALAPESAAESAAVPVTTAPRQDEPAVLLRPARPARSAQAAEEAAPLQLPPDRPADRFAHLPGLSLMAAILTVQAVLSAQFLRADTAFGGEARDLWAGHLEWAHWLHGAAIPAFPPSWFSGSPVIYPPLAALADGLGGLAAARILSLAFMLGATCLLWGTTARLFGRRPAFFAAALFAVIAPTLHVGTLATYDSMALFLIALAAWCACGARTRDDATGWILACAGALALANATEYASALFDPVVVLMAVLCACPRPGGKAAMRRGSLLLTCLAGMLAVLLRVGGQWYITGISQTTTMRLAGTDTLRAVLTQSWAWTGVVAVAALAGLAVSIIARNARSVSYLITALVAASLLVPIGQARVQTTASLARHLDFGAWFACIAAGYALGSVVSWPKARTARVVVAACVGAAIAPVAALGIRQAQPMVNWPGSANLIAFLKPLTLHGGRFLADTAEVPEYYLPQTRWQQWSNTFEITLPGGQVHTVNGNPAAYAQAISQHYFSLVILDFSETPVMDEAITHALRATPGYTVIRDVGYAGPVRGDYTVWAYRPGGGTGGS